MPATNQTSDQIIETVTRFQHAFEPNDVDTLMSCMTEDTVFEHIAPEGVSFGRYEGHDAVRAVWESMPEHFPGCRFVIDDIFATADRCTCRYTLTFKGPDGPVVRRGVDVFRMRDGKIAEKLAYLTL